MWRDYFPNAEIVVVDINAKAVSGPRLRFEQGDQSDPVFLQALIEKYGPFDIVIDDGSHRGSHITVELRHAMECCHARWYVRDRGSPACVRCTLRGRAPAPLAPRPSSSRPPLTTPFCGRNPAAYYLFRPSIAAMHIYGGIAFFEKAK